MDIIDYLKMAVEQKASDIFILAGGHLSFKIDGVITRISEEKLKPEDTETLIAQLFRLGNREMVDYLKKGDDDFAISVSGLSRFRVSAYRQRGTMAAVIRTVSFVLPDYREMQIPEEIIRLGSITRGLVIVTGPTGSGKTTTLNCMVDYINKTRNSHVITLEDPIEYLHRNDKSLISQRELALDTEDTVTALRACLRQAPDVILLGELRDYETIKTVMTAAETGHLVLSTLHTIGAVNTIDRIIDVFPPNQQHQIRVQLSMILTAVVSQQLIPDVNGGLTAAFEIMYVNPAIKNMIREGKTYQIDNAINAGAAEGMVSMDASILKMYKDGIITGASALNYAVNRETLEKKLK